MTHQHACPCCKAAQCEYCQEMGYTWPSAKPFKGKSLSALYKHVDANHPTCCTVDRKKQVHPATNRPLLVEALPVDQQQLLKKKFKNKIIPPFHPYAKPISSLFEINACKASGPSQISSTIFIDSAIGNSVSFNLLLHFSVFDNVSKVFQISHRES